MSRSWARCSWAVGPTPGGNSTGQIGRRAAASCPGASGSRSRVAMLGRVGAEPARVNGDPGLVSPDVDCLRQAGLQGLPARLTTRWPSRTWRVIICLRSRARRVPARSTGVAHGRWRRWRSTITTAVSLPQPLPAPCRQSTSPDPGTGYTGWATTTGGRHLRGYLQQRAHRQRAKRSRATTPR